MAKKHMKTITAPVSWPIKRKGQKFIIRPKPGKKFALSMPLALVFKNMLKSCKTLREVKSILNDKEILVDNQRRKNPKYLLGFMDVLSIPVSKEYFRMSLSRKNKLCLLPIDKKESNVKVCKIEGKTILKGGNTQLNLFDGRNLTVKKDNYKVGESVLIETPSQDMKDHFKLEKGAYVFLIGGKHVGEHGKIKKVSEKEEMVEIETKKEKFETLKKFVFIVGKDKPAIKINE